jgi:hypothetical protein
MKMDILEFQKNLLRDRDSKADFTNKSKNCVVHNTEAEKDTETLEGMDEHIKKADVAILILRISFLRIKRRIVYTEKRKIERTSNYQKCLCI